MREIEKDSTAVKRFEKLGFNDLHFIVNELREIFFGCHNLNRYCHVSDLFLWKFSIKNR